ncbi:CAP family protein [Streptomyces sp. SAI-149]|uniref:CAP family protein n=1 Tax=Streptomyces sp. SAI-149 TaxID=2940542 RepID=UPI0024733AF3|nr:CAP family protein [Streptomyces sp. SAI-149]MDH6499518.1 uncharacterized protein YkwD [Streptomyces sp. SAI-149]
MIDGEQVADPTPDASGTFRVAVTIPKSATGSVVISAIIGNGGSADAIFKVKDCPKNPTMATVPKSGVVGSKFVQKGNNWLPGGKVRITLPHGSKAFFLAQSATPRIGPSGGWQTVVTVGKGTPSGTYSYTATERAPQCPSGKITMKDSFTVKKNYLRRRSSWPPVSHPTTKMARIVNEYRARHGVAPLRVDDELAASAQRWADQGKFKHSGGGGRYGENLYASGGPCTEDDIRKAVDLWYAEAEQYGYDYNHPDTEAADRTEFNKGVGHFTQLVWKGSTKIGVGVASHPGNKWQCLVVAQFSPPGNYMGSFRENVLPPKSRQTVSHIWQESPF